MKYVFDKELQEAIIIKRNSQFTMNVDIDGTVVKCHCPATTRIADVDLTGVKCLVSESDDLKRKLKYTVEAVSFDNPDSKDKNWNINLKFTPTGVSLLKLTNTTQDLLSY